MLRNFRYPNRRIPPLHLDQVQIAVDFNHSVNLFGDAFSVKSLRYEGFTNENGRAFDRHYAAYFCDQTLRLQAVARPTRRESLPLTDAFQYLTPLPKALLLFLV